MAWNTAYDLDSLMVNTKAATVYTAHENSLFLTGGLIPMIQLPAGSVTAQVPVLGSVTATKLTSASHNAEDFSAVGITDQKKTIEASIYAAREVVRDLGGIDANELGRVLGNAIQTAFDKDVVAEFANFTASADVGTLSVGDLFDAVAQIRGAGETGALVGVISPAAAAELMKEIGTNAYAGGDFQSEAMRMGFVGTVAGVRLFQSSYATPANVATGFKGAIFAQDAMRIAMFKNVDLEVQRRAAAVGNDIVASLHAGVGVIDAARGVKLVDAA